MLQSVSSWLSATLGLGLPGSELDFFHMASRGVVVFALGISAMRVVAHRRFLSRRTPFDMILGIMLGAILARAVNGTAPFVPTVGSAAVLLLLDRLIALGVYRWGWFRHLMEGRTQELVRDGSVDPRAMRRFLLSRDDLLTALREHAHVESLDLVARACIEPSGEISVVLRPPAEPA